MISDKVLDWALKLCILGLIIVVWLNIRNMVTLSIKLDEVDYCGNLAEQHIREHSYQEHEVTRCIDTQFPSYNATLLNPFVWSVEGDKIRK